MQVRLLQQQAYVARTPSRIGTDDISERPVQRDKADRDPW